MSVPFGAEESWSSKVSEKKRFSRCDFWCQNVKGMHCLLMFFVVLPYFAFALVPLLQIFWLAFGCVGLYGSRGRCGGLCIIIPLL